MGDSISNKWHVPIGYIIEVSGAFYGLISSKTKILPNFNFMYEKLFRIIY